MPPIVICPRCKGRNAFYSPQYMNVYWCGLCHGQGRVATRICECGNPLLVGPENQILEHCYRGAKHCSGELKLSYEFRPQLSANASDEEEQFAMLWL